MMNSEIPPSLLRRNMPVVIFAVLALSLPFWFDLIGGYKGLDTKIMIWIIFCIGFDLLLGFTGYLSFGHAAFFGVSAYATGLMLLHYSDNVIPAFFAGIAASTVVALVIGLLTLRRTGIYFSILTLAFAEMLHSAFLSSLSDWTGGENGLTGLATPQLFGIVLQDLNVYYFVTVIAILGFYVARRIVNSPYGLMLRAIKSNQTRLEYTGINVQGYKLTVFLLSSVYAAVAGSLIVIYEPYVAIEFLGWHTSGNLVIMSVLGGVGTLYGPMIGAAFMLYFENVISVFLEEQWLLVLGIIFMLVVAFLPGGFVDGARKLYRRFKGQGGEENTAEAGR